MDYRAILATSLLATSLSACKVNHFLNGGLESCFDTEESYSLNGTVASLTNTTDSLASGNGHRVTQNAVFPRVDISLLVQNEDVEGDRLVVLHGSRCLKDYISVGDEISHLSQFLYQGERKRNVFDTDILTVNGEQISLDFSGEECNDPVLYKVPEY